MIQDSILSGLNSDPSIDLDASILSDYHGDHWGFTGTFVGLVCQDLTDRQLSAEFDYLEVR
ncbi:MAG: hypothetical protein ACR2N1_02740 [Rubripirellula sp.]